jgi:hypothetical protein
MMTRVLIGTTASGKPLMKCPTCGATSDVVTFFVDASAGLAECHNTAKHSLPAKGKLKDFDPNKTPEPTKP